MSSEHWIAILLFGVGLVMLIKGGDWFVDGASGIAHRFHIPEILIGATVVSIGTTLPEVMVSSTSAFQGHGEIAYGNAIGSVICNTALISAITIAARPTKVDRKTFRTPVLFFFIAAAIYSLIAYFSDTFERWHGVALLVLFVIYMTVTVTQALRGSKNGDADAAPADAEEPELPADEPSKGKFMDFVAFLRGKKQFGARAQLIKDLVFLVLGAAVIAIGADLLVDNGIIIARDILGVPEAVVALTFVALGTSLPELVTAITSLAKGHGSLSLGNVIGANLFNLVLVSGLSITISPFNVPMTHLNGLAENLNSSLILDIPLMLFVMAFMTLPPLIRGKLSRFQGIVLLCTYAAFCVVQFTLVG